MEQNMEPTQTGQNMEQNTQKNNKKIDKKENNKKEKKEKQDPLFTEGVRIAKKWTSNYVNERVVEKVDDDQNSMIKLMYGIESVEEKKNTNFMLFSFDSKVKKDKEGEIIVTNKLLIGTRINEECDKWLEHIRISFVNSDMCCVYWRYSPSIDTGLNKNNSFQIAIITGGSSFKDIDTAFMASNQYLKDNKLVDFGEDDEFIDYSEEAGIEW